MILMGSLGAVRGESALVGFAPNADSTVGVVVVQPDGKTLLGGDFTSLSPNGGALRARNRIARLNPDGTLDTAFNANANGIVYAIALQTDGKMLIGGDFTILSPNGAGPFICNRIARLDPDGTLATAFNAHANRVVFSIAVQKDGKILAGGDSMERTASADRRANASRGSMPPDSLIRST